LGSKGRVQFARRGVSRYTNSNARVILRVELRDHHDIFVGLLQGADRHYGLTAEGSGYNATCAKGGIEAAGRLCLRKLLSNARPSTNSPAILIALPFFIPFFSPFVLAPARQLRLEPL
jgi:hypothetical protein